MPDDITCRGWGPTHRQRPKTQPDSVLVSERLAVARERLAECVHRQQHAVYRLQDFRGDPATVALLEKQLADANAEYRRVCELFDAAEAEEKKKPGSGKGTAPG